MVRMEEEPVPQSLDGRPLVAWVGAELRIPFYEGDEVRKLLPVSHTSRKPPA